MLGQLALASAAAFAGAAIYVSWAEHPARLKLDDAAALRQWAPSYHRGAVLQGTLAVVSGLVGAAAWWRRGEVFWLVGAVLILVNWPYTLAIIMPTNRRLEAMASSSPAETRQLLVRWGHLHAARSALGVLATVSYLAALHRGS